MAGRPISLDAAIAAGRTVVCCDWPPLNGHAHGWLIVNGWAHSPGGIHEVVISVDGVRQPPVRNGLPRPDLAFERGIDPDCGFRGRYDTRDWGRGSHLVSVAALAGDGSVARASGMLDVSPHGAYRAWLARAGRPVASKVLGRTRSVSADGRDLSEPLRRLARRRRGHLLLVEPGGELAPGAAARIGSAFRGRPPPDLVYADEDAVVEDGGRGAEFLKPGWSPELLLSTDYVGPLLGVGPAAAQAALEAGGGPIATIHELLLRLLDAPLRVEHLPEVLYTGAGARIGADDERAREAIEALGERRGLRPRIAAAGVPGGRHVGWEIRGEPKVSIVIPTAAGDVLEGCLRSLRELTTHAAYELRLVDSSDGRLQRQIGLLDGIEHQVVPYDGPRDPFGYSRACNLGARNARGDYLLFLDDDTEVRSPDWIERLLEHAQLDGVGVVGARLLFPDGDVQHAGINVARDARGAYNLLAHLPAGEPGHRGIGLLIRNPSAVSSACMMVPADHFRRLGGFDESLMADYCDPDLCLRSAEAGGRVVWTPLAVLVHREKTSRDVPADPGDLNRFQARWGERFAGGDPLYHPAFADFPSYAIGEPFPPSNVGVGG